MGVYVCVYPICVCVCVCFLLYCTVLSCVWLCDPMDCSPPGSSVHGILQARILEWVAISSSRGSSLPRDWTCVCYVSCVSCVGKWILYTEAPGKPVYVNTILLLLLLSRFSRVRLCDHRDGSPPGSPVPGIFQARTLEWLAISFSNAWKWKVKVKSLSRVRLLSTPRTAAYQASPSMGFSRQEYWSGVPLPSPKFSSSFSIIFVMHSSVDLFFIFLSFCTLSLFFQRFMLRFHRLRVLK